MPNGIRYTTLGLAGLAILVFLGPVASAQGEGQKREEIKHQGDLHDSDLVGIWEAIDVASMRLFVLDIREATYDSFVSMVTSETRVFAVHSMVTKDRRVEILADGRGNASSYSVKISAKGWATNGEGLLDATIVLRDADGKRIYTTWRVAMLGYKGNLARKFCQAKEASDAAIAEARAQTPGATSGQPH